MLVTAFLFVCVTSALWLFILLLSLWPVSPTYCWLQTLHWIIHHMFFQGVGLFLFSGVALKHVCVVRHEACLFCTTWIIEGFCDSGIFFLWKFYSYKRTPKIFWSPEGNDGMFKKYFLETGTNSNIFLKFYKNL